MLFWMQDFYFDTGGIDTFTSVKDPSSLFHHWLLDTYTDLLA